MKGDNLQVQGKSPCWDLIQEISDQEEMQKAQVFWEVEMIEVEWTQASFMILSLLSLEEGDDTFHLQL